MREGHKNFVAKGNWSLRISLMKMPQRSTRLPSLEILAASSQKDWRLWTYTLLTPFRCSPCLQTTDGSFPQTNQFSLYNFLFNNNFDARDALEDVLALRKILFSSKLELATQTIIDNSYLVSASHAVQDLEYLDRRQMLMQSFKSSLSQCLRKSMTEKIAGSGLAFEDLKRVYSKYGKKGVIAILSKRLVFHIPDPW